MEDLQDKQRFRYLASMIVASTKNLKISDMTATLHTLGHTVSSSLFLCTRRRGNRGHDICSICGQSPMHMNIVRRCGATNSATSVCSNLLGTADRLVVAPSCIDCYTKKICTCLWPGRQTDGRTNAWTDFWRLNICFC